MALARRRVMERIPMTLDPAQNLKDIMESPTYLRAEDDAAFIKSPELRPLRLAMELMKAEFVQQEHQINSTIVLFGGTRVIEEGDAKAKLEDARSRLAASPDDPALRQRVEIAERVAAKCKYYDEARRFGAIVSQTDQGGEGRENVIVTGGGPGIMEAGNRGAADVGADSIGLNITLPHEQTPNAYITPELCFQFHYFAIRKMHFLIRAKAMVGFPGGFGTMDEVFETLTLIQTHTMHRIPIVLFGKDYWTRIINFDAFVEEGVIDPQDLDLFDFAETAEEAWAIICRFYDDKKNVRRNPISRS